MVALDLVNKFTWKKWIQLGLVTFPVHGPSNFPTVEVYDALDIPMDREMIWCLGFQSIQLEAATVDGSELRRENQFEVGS